MYENNKIKRGKIAFYQALPIKLVVQVFRMSEACRTNEAGARSAPSIIINTSEAKPRFCERYL